MPIYDYECPIHGQFWKVQPKEFGTVKYSICCPEEDCDAVCDKLAPLTANIQLGKPSIVFVNPQNGAAQIAGSEHDSPPPGFVKHELKGSIERSKFEQQQSAIHAQEDAIYNENLRQGREEARARVLKNIDDNTRADAEKSTNPAETARLMQAAKQYIQNKPALKRKRKTEFRFDVNHLDKSNLK